jgi:Copine
MGGAGGPVDFVDYVSGGCQLNVVVGIDFTGSNGDPRQPGTLHYRNNNDPSFRNDYEKAIAAIVSILAKFDSDQKFPVYGFGAKYDGEVRHCFQCGPTEEANGVQGVLDAYRAVFASGLIMSGPTDITELLQTAAARAQSSQDAAARRGQQAFTIVLVLTDGALSDIQKSAAVLKQIAGAPLSVVIVGVGNADFSSMRFLDDCSPGNKDITQFVQFNQHSRDSVALTSETLREIPNQLVGYFQRHNIPPLPPVQRSDDDIVIEPEEPEINLNLDFASGDDAEIVVKSGGDDFVSGFAASR